MKPLVLILLGLLAACAAPVPEPLGPDNRAPDLGEPGEPDYHVLMAEIAMQRDRPALAATEYLRAARASEDLELAERAARVTAAYGTGEEALAAARHWAALAPEATLARRFLARGYLRSDKAEMAIPELARRRALRSPPWWRIIPRTPAAPMHTPTWPCARAMPRWPKRKRAARSAWPRNGPRRSCCGRGRWLPTAAWKRRWRGWRIGRMPDRANSGWS